MESFLVPVIQVLKARELGTKDPGSKVEELRLTKRMGVNNQVCHNLKGEHQPRI